MSPLESVFLLVKDAVFLLFFGGLAVETIARLGAPFVPKGLSKRPAAGFGVGLAGGFAVSGFILLGFACAGLAFRSFILPFLFLASAGVSLRMKAGWTPLALRAGRDLFKRARLESILVFAAALPFLIRFISPLLCHDATIYHYGAPWHFLLAHKVLLENVPFPFHLPLAVEAGLMFPLSLGDHRLASFMIFMILFAVLLVFMDGCIKNGRKTAAWAGPVVLLSIGTVLEQAGTGKADISSAAFFVLGALLWERGYVSAGAVFLGICLASKYVYLPLVAMWLVLFPPPACRLGFVLAALVLPAVPWLLKSWLATADPLFPFGHRYFNGPFWNEVNASAFQKYHSNWIQKSVLFSAGLSGGWFRWLVNEALPVSLLLPGILHRSKSAWVCLASIPLILSLTGISRYTLPATALLALLAASCPSTIRPALRSWLLVAAGVWGLTRIALHPPAMGFDPGFLGRHSREYFLESLHAYGEAVGKLEGLKPRRVLLIGDHITYPLPGRIVSSGFMGETPLVWKIARESKSLRDFGKRIRQTGADALLYNYAGAYELAADARRYFRWDDRMGLLYSEFARAGMREAGKTEICARIGGGFYIFGVRPSSKRPPASLLSYLPGAEDLLLDAELKSRKLTHMGQGSRAFVPYERLVGRFPRVLEYRAALGSAYAAARKWKESFEAYLPAYENDLVSCRMTDFAQAAFHLSRCDTARAFCERSVRRYPDAKQAMLECLRRECISK